MLHLRVTERLLAADYRLICLPTSDTALRLYAAKARLAKL